MFSEWHFEITREGADDLKRLDAETRGRILEKLKWFVENFNYLTPLPLGGPWKGFFKLRVGDWRVVYEVGEEKRLITIHVIDSRDAIDPLIKSPFHGIIPL